MNGRGAALVNVHLAGQQRLRRGRSAERAEIHGHAALAEVTGFVRQNDRQIERAGRRNSDFEASFFRFQLRRLGGVQGDIRRNTKSTRD